MITLIGVRCKRSNALSRGVLIDPFPLGNLVIMLFLFSIFSQKTLGL